MWNCFTNLTVSVSIGLTAAVFAHASTFHADSSNFEARLRSLRPGDTLSLAPGRYPPLNLNGLNGTPDDWITIAGPPAGEPAVIVGQRGINTVEITDCSYLAIENLVIDSRGIPGAFGISARGKENNRTHHIRIERNTLVGQNGGQQTDGISTKTPTWGWVIRYNKIIGAGTGLYLGDSDATQPFVAGIIENNLVKDTIGYNMEIKDQQSIPDIPGMPLSPTSTIIRNNTFIKDDQPSPDGDRPNVLVGTRPPNGLGALNRYEIYGNYFAHNHREALFQGSGSLSLHDNIFIDGPRDYPAVVLMKQDQALKYAVIYNNTVYTLGAGIRFNRAGTNGVAVGNLIFSSNPIAGLIETGIASNVTVPPELASQYVRSPTFDVGTADFYPLPLRCQGAPIDLTAFQTDTDYTLDFNGAPKTQAKGAVIFRGAYAGEGQNPGLFTGIKPPYPPQPKIPRLVWIRPTNVRPGTRTQFTVTGANFTENATVNVSGGDATVTGVTIKSETEITGTLIVESTARQGTREITVTTAIGASSPFKILLSSRK